MAATCVWVSSKLEECYAKPGHVVLVMERLLQRSEGAIRPIEYGGTVRLAWAFSEG